MLIKRFSKHTSLQSRKFIYFAGGPEKSNAEPVARKGVKERSPWLPKVTSQRKAECEVIADELTIDPDEEILNSKNTKEIMELFKDKNLKIAFSTLAKFYHANGYDFPDKSFYDQPAIKKLVSVYNNSDDYGKLYIGEKLDAFVCDQVSADFMGGLFSGDRGFDRLDTSGRILDWGKIRAKRDNEIFQDYLNGKVPLTEKYRSAGTVNATRNLAQKELVAPEPVDYERLLWIPVLEIGSTKVCVSDKLYHSFDGSKNVGVIEDGFATYGAAIASNGGNFDLVYYQADPKVFEITQVVKKP